MSCGPCAGAINIKEPRRRHRSSSTATHTTSVRPSSSSAFSRSTSGSRTRSRYHPRRHRYRYTLKARLLPSQCRCVGGVTSCPQGNPTPQVSSIPNLNVRSGYGDARFVLDWDPNTKLGTLSWEISYYKLYSYGGLTPAKIVGVEIRGPAVSCNVVANIVINALGIYLLDTGGESPDGYVLGQTTINKAKADQLLKGQWYIVIRSLAFLTPADGELSGPILYKRKEKLSRSC